MQKKYFQVTALLFLILVGFYSFSQEPRVFIIDAKQLVELKHKIKEKDKLTIQLVDSLKRRADALLNKQPVSVMDKTITPVSGNKHDYMSQAPYFWYDSTKPNGLPYIRRDGQHNPEIKKITDKTYLDDLSAAVRILSLAWYLTGNNAYAEKTSTLIRHWFFNEDTKMNPHLEYAQAIPGINTGRGIGLIESRALIYIADAAGLLAGSKAWSEKDTKALQQWYSQFLNWMLTSKNGKDEHAAKNNHGTWYMAQVIDFALFTDDVAKAKQLAEESKQKIDSQVSKEGKMQLELDRTNGLGYTTFNIAAWFNVARLAEKVGIDLWNYTNKNGVSIRTALDWLQPYASGEKPWPYEQIGNYNRNEFYPLLLQAADKYKDKNYLKNFKEGSDLMTDLLYRR